MLGGDRRDVVSGSSARVRERHGQLVGSCDHSRLIPACAGETCVAHTPMNGASGSSPRVRERRFFSNTVRRRRSAHPRVCGRDPRGSFAMVTRHATTAHPCVRGRDAEPTRSQDSGPSSRGSSVRARERRMGRRRTRRACAVHPRERGRDEASTRGVSRSCSSRFVGGCRFLRRPIG